MATALAAEPTSIKQVKVLAIRAAAKSEVSDMCLYALDARLRLAGHTVQDTTDGADAVMVATFEYTPEQSWPFGDDAATRYAIVVKSLPGEHVLFADQGYLESDDIARGCKKIAEKISKKLAKEMGQK